MGHSKVGYCCVCLLNLARKKHESVNEGISDQSVDNLCKIIYKVVELNLPCLKMKPSRNVEETGR